MSLPDFFGIGVTSKQALLLLSLLKESSSYCDECAALEQSLTRQINILAGVPVPIEGRGCSNCP